MPRLQRIPLCGDRLKKRAKSSSIEPRALRPPAQKLYNLHKSGQSRRRRQPVTSFGATGNIALVEIASASVVVVLAQQHQSEADRH